MRKFLILLLLLVVAAAIQFGPSEWEKYQSKNRAAKAAALAHLTTDIGRDVAILKAAFDAKGELPNKPTVSGLPLVISVEAGVNFDGDPYRYGEEPCISPLMHDLPEALVANNADEIGTLVGLMWGDYEAGTYEITPRTGAHLARPKGPSAMVDTCRIVVVDKKTGQRLGTAEARGTVGQFPTSPSDDYDFYGERCDPQVLDYIKLVFLSDHSATSNLRMESGERIFGPPKKEEK